MCTRSRVCKKGWGYGLHVGPCYYQALSNLIIVKSIVGMILYLCVLCNYTEL